MKIVVFDLDETIGYFTEYGIFYDCLINYLRIKNKKELTQHDFNNILDLFPEFLRPNIINILAYLKTKKQSTCCHKMMIYTNNTGPREWARRIIKYFETKLQYKLIDQIISAFKVNGKQVEICRTTHNKTHKDFIKCTKICANAEICFLDDTLYPDMVHDNIYYINIKPYFHDLKIEYMIEKFIKSGEGKKLVGDDNDYFKEFMCENFNKYNYDVVEKDEKEYYMDKILGKQILLHLHDFFNKNKKNKTYKNKSHKKNKTQKHKNT